MDKAKIRTRTREHVRHTDRVAYDVSVRIPSQCPAKRVAQAADEALRALADWKYEDPIRAARIVDEREPLVRVVPFGLMVTIEFSLLQERV